MTRIRHGRTRWTLAGAAGLAVVLGTPLFAQADSGKWWTPKQGGGPHVEGRGRYGHGGGQGRAWRGGPVRRDIVVIRETRNGGYFRARRVFYQPYYQRRTVYVRPVRYFISADALIGGIGIHARIVRPHYAYGCNFCDARFETYHDYCEHVDSCSHRPSGYQINHEDWDDDADWKGPYPTDGCDHRGQSGDYRDDGRYRGDDDDRYRDDDSRDRWNDRRDRGDDEDWDH